MESLSPIQFLVLALQDDLQVRRWTRLMKPYTYEWMILGDCMSIIVGPDLLKIDIDGMDGTAASGYQIL